MGFRVEYDFVAQGWKFRKNKLKATVCKIYRINNPPSLEQLSPMTKSHLVEVSVISSSSDERAAAEVNTFSEQLKPLLNLEKKDPRRQDM